MSCESEEGSEKNSGSYNYQEKGKVDPGTYHYPNQRNPWFGDGCKGRSNSTCVLVVTSLQSPVIDFQAVAVDDAFVDAYINENMNAVNQNLSLEELSLLKESMEFNSDSMLISWNMELLEKGTKESFDNVIYTITEKMGGITDNIVIVYESGRERAINPK